MTAERKYTALSCSVSAAAPGKAYEPLSIVELGGPTGSNPAAEAPVHGHLPRPPAHIGRCLVPFRAQTPIRPTQAQ